MALSTPARPPANTSAPLDSAAPRALVLRAPGTNCDQEMLRGFTLAGAAADLLHLDALCRDPAILDRYHLVGFPGGFSYGDDIASGRIFAMRARERLWPAFRRALDRHVPIIGACNGFQVLVQLGLLPGPDLGQPWPSDQPPAQSVALTDNASARFLDRWVGFTVEAAAPCIWTQNLTLDLPAAAHTEACLLPIAHGEGRLVAPSPTILDHLERSHRVALRYTVDVNGSANRIAGLCDASGLVFGLMPHPERYLDWTRHPYWTRLDPTWRSGPTPGLRMFQNAVAHARAAAAR